MDDGVLSLNLLLANCEIESILLTGVIQVTKAEYILTGMIGAV